MAQEEILVKMKPNKPTLVSVMLFVIVATITSGDNFRSRDSRTRGNIIENIHIFFFFLR